MLEVCIDSFESAVNAINGGADELEVCSSLTEGGLTPSAGLVRLIIEEVSKKNKKTKVNVMIRCRTGSDFCYTTEEMDTMLADIQIFKQYRPDRFVFGALTEHQLIDDANCAKIIDTAEPIPVTFHRAYDICKDPIDSIDKIVQLGFSRLLTSGQKLSVNDIGAVKLIKSLMHSHGDKIDIMPGAGINADNARTFIDLGCRIVHSSCKRIKYLPKVGNGLCMGTSDSEHIFVTDEDLVRKMKEVIS